MTDIGLFLAGQKILIIPPQHSFTIRIARALKGLFRQMKNIVQLMASTKWIKRVDYGDGYILTWPSLTLVVIIEIAIIAAQIYAWYLG